MTADPLPYLLAIDRVATRLTIIRIWIDHWRRRWRAFPFFLTSTTLIIYTFRGIFPSRMIRTRISPMSSLIIIFISWFLYNIKTHYKCQNNDYNGARRYKHCLYVIARLQFTLRHTSVRLKIVTWGTAIGVTISSNAFTVFIAVVSGRFISLADDMLGAVSVTATSSSCWAVSIVLALLITHHGVWTHFVNTTPAWAFKSKVAKIFLHFKSMQTHRWVSAWIITAAKCAHKAILIDVAKDLLNALVKVLI